MDRTPIVAPASSIRRTIAMLLVDCPLCDTASPFDTDDDALDCPRCDVRLELAQDAPAAFAEAA